jgi:1,4-dihydroxy-2-naphthoyl-CoA hydrolase
VGHVEGFDSLIGTEIVEHGRERARAHLAVRDDLLQPYGLVHGGVFGTLAESVCSFATDEAVKGEGMTAIGQSNSVTYLRPITAGHVNADAHARHRGRTTWVWDVEISDDEGRVCALSRVVIAVRPRR